MFSNSATLHPMSAAHSSSASRARAREASSLSSWHEPVDLLARETEKKFARRYLTVHKLFWLRRPETESRSRDFLAQFQFAQDSRAEGASRRLLLAAQRLDIVI